MNNTMPETIIKVYPKNAPWMSVKLKELIRMRQITFHSSNHGPVFNFYRNTANRESKRCKGMNYASKVQDLKGVNPRRWWNEIHNLCVSKKQSSSLFSSLKVPASRTCLHLKLPTPSATLFWILCSLTSPWTATLRLPYCH